MSAKPKPLKPEMPAKRDARVPDLLWEFPATLARLSVAHGFFQKEVAKAAGVTQSAVSRWMHYKGLNDIAAAKVVRIERGLGLHAGVLLPQADPEDAADLKRHATEMGVPSAILVALADKAERERMQAFSEDVRRAILGIVHVYRVPIEQASAAARRALAKCKPIVRNELDAPTWYEKIRDELKGAHESGTHPSDRFISAPASNIK